ncbi:MULTISPECIES: bifunctional DNA-formamidopyrimidine glycosylase/DNA-(apurinic or apyrimidinic site) lyase [unclassified Brevibacterium]|uniref:bifunctional DNA-formamidopyrimidine glycosylase/DNA-(apurinic or apyrimidinic site) lyase n=1 Tax=unclassified Brevibacterium TaxID=2614124 RepID=UPI001081493C|nr:bifunctional DNA-formamidopyrimidine glycosylase/DNA-(apurinic or apyrimidinic site) lyase [Brevibacterium sp. S111]TGD11336.1 bifunctional DNA-formamidopyrimidine glycosylase/DNA-(apurinic or apyrimidinic site) lyase [Brevibacterium sp. S111]
MPELPEVESVRRGVDEWTTGTTITGAEVIDPRILGTTSQRRIDPSAIDGFVTAVNGAHILGAERRGKFMWLSLGEGSRPQPGPADRQNTMLGETPELGILVHLGMSGQLRIHDPNDELHRHTRAILRLGGSDSELGGRAGDGATNGGAANGGGGVAGVGRELRFVDQRIFGHIGVQPLVHGYGRLVPASAIHIAADPLEPAFDPERVVEALAKKRTAIKAALLDQTLVSGIGNIYADEALFRAGVHPSAVPARTRKSRLVAVLESATKVMTDALAVGGTSFDALYVNVNGESGYFDRALLVYGRGGQECVRCGTEIARITVGGRGTHFCPECQKPPRYR